MPVQDHVNPVQFAQIVPMGDHFGLEADPEFPLEDRMADTEDALLGRLVRQFHNLPEGTTIDVQLTNSEHIKFTSESGSAPTSEPS